MENTSERRSQSLRLMVLTSEPPYPAFHGGRVDQWNRWNRLRKLGCSADLITWVESPLAAEHRNALEQVFDRVVDIPRRKSRLDTLFRLIYLAKYPSHVASRVADLKVLRELTAGAMPYDAVFLDGLYGGQLGALASKHLSIPLLYRSHNIEHVYMPNQMRSATSLASRFRLWLSTWHLKSFEEKIHRSAKTTFDISLTDMAYWKGRGLSEYVWAPPLLPVNVTADPTVEKRERSFDFVFLGNLNTPNNIEGIRWFISDVLPIIRHQIPQPTLLVGGSNPSSALVGELSNVAGVTVVVSPPDADAFRRRGSVLINPVRRGSGVNVKSVEMLATSSPIVSTPVAVQGLTDDVRRHFLIAEEAEAFAQACLDARQNGVVDMTGRANAIDQFADGGARALFEQIVSSIETGLTPRGSHVATYLRQDIEN